MQVRKVVLTALITGGTAVFANAGTVVVSGGASMLQSASGEAQKLSSLRVDCASTNRTNVGFLCGFDDGQRTVLQFEERDGAPVVLFDAEGKEIAGVRRIGSYYVLPQLYRMVFVRAGGKEAVLLRGTSSFVEAKQASAPVGASTPAPASAGAVAAAGEPVKPIKPVPTWTLTAGHTIGKDLQEWGKRAGWRVIWDLPKDWAVPASTVFQGDFKTAASSVIKNLSANGAMIRAQFFDGNNTLVVNGPGLASQ